LYCTSANTTSILFVVVFCFVFVLFYCCDENICIVATTVAKLSFICFFSFFRYDFLCLATNYRTLTDAHENKNRLSFDSSFLYIQLFLLFITGVCASFVFSAAVCVCVCLLLLFFFSFF